MKPASVAGSKAPDTKHRKETAPRKQHGQPGTEMPTYGGKARLAIDEAQQESRNRRQKPEGIRKTKPSH